MQDLNNSLLSGPHRELNRMAGEWQGQVRTWFEPDKLADVSAMAGTIEPVLGGRFLLHRYKGEMQGKPLEGLSIIGYHLELRKYQVIWMDTFHMGTAMLFSESAEGASFNVNGSWIWVGPEERQTWGWRTEIEMISDDEIRMTAYNVTPQGEEAKATELYYKRKKKE